MKSLLWANKHLTEHLLGTLPCAKHPFNKVPLNEWNQHMPFLSKPEASCPSCYLPLLFSPINQVVLSIPCLLHLSILLKPHVLYPTSATAISPGFWISLPPVSPLTASVPGSCRRVGMAFLKHIESGHYPQQKLFSGFRIVFKVKSKCHSSTRRPLLFGPS